MSGLARAWVAVAAATYGLAAGAAVLDRYRHLHLPNGLDQGYFLQRAWQAGELAEPVRTLLNTEQGHGLVATRHFEPILSLFVPAVAVWPDHRVLLLGQLLLLAATLPLAWRLARLHLRPHQAALCTWALLGTPLLWQLEAHGFRTMALATPLVAGTLWAASTGRLGWTALFGLGALACREEVVWALGAALPWLWWWRGRRWRDTTWLLGALCVGWLALLAAVQGGPSTFWKLGELPRALADRMGQAGGADHTSAVGAALFLGRWLGPSLGAVVLAPLAALPLVVWWVGIQASSGLAGPEAVHLLGPALGTLCLVLPLGLARLPRRLVTPVLVVLVGWGAWSQGPGVRGALGTLAPADPHPAGDVWDLVAAVPRDAALLTEARLLPAVAARERIYATEDWRDPSRLDGHYTHALVREDHPWRGHLEAHGLRVARVVPGLALWQTASPAALSGPPLTPE